MTEPLFQVERRRLADQVADQLMALIADGKLKPGDRLPSELELMKQFQVGRSSIREAIGALSLIGLVTVKPGQGTHVADFSPEGDANRIGLICGLESGGKISQEEAYDRIKQLWKQLKQSKKNLRVGDGPVS